MTSVAYPNLYLSRFDRACAAAQAVTVIAIWSTSTVGGAFWHFAPIAPLLTIVYLITLAGVALNPNNEYRHAGAAMAGVLWWFGRGGAFYELYLGGASNLLGSTVRDAIGGTTAILTVHVYGMYRARITTGTESDQ